MTSSALINQGKELEVNLVESASEVDDEGYPVGPGYYPTHEGVRQPPSEQVRWPCVRPVLGQPEIRGDGRSARNHR